MLNIQQKRLAWTLQTTGSACSNVVVLCRPGERCFWAISQCLLLSGVDSFAVSVFVVDVELTNIIVFVNSISTTNTETAMLSSRGRC